MVRTYKPKLRSPRGRMLHAVELRKQGLSLREIAKKLHVHHDTVWRDLRKWDAERAKVTKLSDRGVGKVTPGGEKSDNECDSESDSPEARVLSFRRSS